MCAVQTFKTIFSRYEKKYVLTGEQYVRLMQMVGPRLQDDAYGKSTVCNIYFDTPDYRLIRASIEKPVFKEKLRMRVYNIPTADSTAFVEIKRKYKGIVYKRRVSMRYDEAVRWLCRGQEPQFDAQRPPASAYCRTDYCTLQQKASLFYARFPFICKEAENLTVTLDSTLRHKPSGL